MATKKAETTSPGIIGQAYEDRRNGESGILISRDTKCKTMNYQRADGTEFTRSYSHFRSYMRKASELPAEEVKAEAYEEAELTSVEVSEEDAKKMEKNAERKERAAEKVKKEKSEYVPKRLSDEEKSGAYEQLCEVVNTFVDSFHSERVTFKRRDYKKSCALNVRGKCLMTMYSRPKRSTVYILSVPQMISGIAHTITMNDLKHHETTDVRKNRTESFTIAFDDLSTYLDELREAIIEILSFVKESEDK